MMSLRSLGPLFISQCSQHDCQDERFPKDALASFPPANHWPLSLAVPRSKSVGIAFQGSCIFIVHPDCTR
eukprot:411965-Pyramimonas_sp.AAC.1